MTKGNSLRIQTCAILVLLSAIARLVSADDPTRVVMKNLQEGDAARIPDYTLKVTIDEPVDPVSLSQGNSLMTCAITQGPLGLAASCKADELPKPVYHPPGTFGTQGADYDENGSLGVGMKARWVSLRTPETNETYEEHRAIYISPQGAVVDAGASRTLNRYPPDDQGMCSWSYNQLHRYWRALGHGFASHVFQVEGDVSESAGLDRMRVRGGFRGTPTGIWRMAVEKSPTRLVREATFFRDVDGRPVEEIRTNGARQFDGVTLAEEGLLRLPINDEGAAIETRVVLQDFKARFDDELFKEVTKALEDLAGEEIQVVDYRSDPKNPTRRTVRLSSQREKDNK